MSEKQAESVFTKYANRVIKQLGNRALYDSTIISYAKKHINRFGGVYPSNQVPNKSGKYIVNTGNDKSSGIHWIALIRTKSNDYVFDSFARPTKNILKTYNGNGRKLKESDRKDIEQDDSNPSQENICGQLSIAWLLAHQDLGLRKVMLI